MIKRCGYAIYDNLNQNYPKVFFNQNTNKPYIDCLLGPDDFLSVDFHDIEDARKYVKELNHSIGNFYSIRKIDLSLEVEKVE